MTGFTAFRLKTIRAVAFAAAASAGLAAVIAPSTAQAGFFEQLFGGVEAAPPAPVYTYEQAAPQSSPDQPRHHEPRKHRVVDAKPVKQMPTDLMHDKTLQVGDAVVMKDGIHVFEGAEGAKHTAKQFAALDDASSLSKKEKLSLVAMDTTRNDPLRGQLNPDTIASGRSAAVSTGVSAGYRITDARGKSVRYVGP